MKRFVLLALLAACGGKAKTTQSASNTEPGAKKEQTLAEAVTYLCDAPARTLADPKYRCGLGESRVCEGDSSDQVALLGAHVKENQTHPRLLEFFNVEGPRKGDELVKLTAEAGVTTCPLADVYRPASTAP